MFRQYLSIPLVLLLCAGACPGPASAAAAGKGLEQSLARVQKKAAERKEFMLNLSQETFSSMQKKVRKSQGSLEFSAPRNFRWEISAPRRELYVNNGKDFWKYTEALRHAQRLPADANELEFIDAVLKLSSLSSLYKVEEWRPEEAKASARPDPKSASATAVGENSSVMSDAPPPRADGVLLVKLIPKAKSRTEKMLLAIDEKNAVAQELRIVFSNGNRTRIVFDGLKTAKVDAARFDFTPPPGVAVDKL